MSENSSKKQDRQAAERAEDLEIEKKQWRLAGMDPEKFSYFFDKYYRRIFEYAYLRTNHREMANDIASEVFEVAWERRAQFRWQGYALGAWLFQIARNVANHHLRRQQVRAETWYRTEHHGVIAAGTPAQDLEDKTDQELVQICLRGLKPEPREAIILRYFMGMSLRQVASATKMPEGTVNSHLRRGKEALRTKLRTTGIRNRLSESAQYILDQASRVETTETLKEDETAY